MSRSKVVIAALCAALIGLAALAGAASAKTVELSKYSSSFNGHDGVGLGSPSFSSVEKLDVNQVTEEVLVASGNGGGAINKFDASGAAQPFSALEGNSIISPQSFGQLGDLEIDNSGQATQGRFYAFSEQGTIKAYLQTGATTSFPISPSGDYCGAAVSPVTGNFWLGIYNQGIKEFTSAGASTGRIVVASPNNMCDFDMDSQGNFYVPAPYSGGPVYKYSPTGEPLGQIDPGPSVAVAIDLSNDDVYVDDGNKVNHYTKEGSLLDTFGLAEGAYTGLSSSRGIAVNEHTHKVYVGNNSGPPTVDVFAPTGPVTIPTVTTGSPEPTSSSAVLNGVVNADGVDTTECKFEWGATSQYGNKTSCFEGGVPTNVFSGGSGNHNVNVEISGLTKGGTYHFRIVAKNANGIESRGADVVFHAASKPAILNANATHINTDGARVGAGVDPEGGNTFFKIEYGTQSGVYTGSAPEGEQHLASLTTAESFSFNLSGLTSGTTYYYRVTAHNDAGTTTGVEHQFTTYTPDSGTDTCPNAQVRQQTGSSLLPDCRGYELASAQNTGGYDVESDLVAGQSPLDAYPQATNSLLYSIHFGTIPGIAGSPTNFGTDPYVATRGANGWTTKYVGLPADGMADEGAFGSPLLGADAGLHTFAFGGKGICDPCFADNSINEPLRLPDGSLVKGMAGTSNPAADPAGEVRKPLSADGSHFIFGAKKKFETAGKEGSTSIYDRNLSSGQTQVVSTLVNGETMSGEVGELDISKDGSRVVVGELISTAKGNDYWHLYMHIGNSPDSIDLTPGASEGAIYDGMSSDGTHVFFTTKDHLGGGDSDASADIYEAAVGSAGPASLRLITTKGGAVSNDDSCTPPGIPNSWNAASGEGKCNAVAFAGGAGVSSGNGTIYFVSPELLDSAAEAEGEANQPNLYVSKPGGNPTFVATIDTSAGKPGPQPPAHPVANEAFAESLGDPVGMTVDQSNGDLYVAQGNAGKISRFKPDGTPDEFSSLGSNSISGYTWQLGSAAAQVAVDNSPSNANGDIYVVNGSFGATKVDIYSQTGAHLGALNGSGDPNGSLGYACGVAVDQSNGDIYIADYLGHIWRYSPTTNPVAEAQYSGGIETGAPGSCDLAAAAGKVYVNLVSAEEVLKFQASDFALGPPPAAGAVHLATGSTAVSTDPATGDVYVDQGSHISVFNSSGVAGVTIGTGKLASSAGVAVNGNNGHVYASRINQFVTEFGVAEVPYTPIEQIGVVHGVQQSGTHSFGDFQVTPDGRFAALGTRQPITGATTLGFEELYRYDANTGTLSCASCATTGASPESDAPLPEHGLALTDDGRVFFTTKDTFTLRDTNERRDVYEWSNGVLNLISTGIDPEDSGLLSVSANGVDAFFYTREKLTPTDENGKSIRIYDAREKGGFLYDPPTPPCAASDECHGAGSPVPPSPVIPTATGTGHDSQIEVPQATPCPKGKVRRAGKCVKKPHQHHHKRPHKRNSTRTHG